MSFSLRRKSLSAAMPFPGRALEIPPRCPSPPFQPIKALSPPPARHQRTKSTTTKLAAATHHNVALPGLPIPSGGKISSSSSASSRRAGTIDIAVFVSPPPPTLKSSLRSSTSSANIKSAKATLTAPPPPRRTASYGSQSPTSTNFSLPSSLRSEKGAAMVVSSSGPSSPTTQASFLGVPIVPRSSLDSLINTGRHRRMTTSEVRV